jgi:hypothetical protein
MPEETPSAKTYLGWGLTIISGLAVLAAVALALWHVFEWLRDGIWPSYPAVRMLADLAIPYPSVSWPWLQGAIDWILAWSAAGLLTCLGIIVAIVGTLLTADYDARVAASAAARGKFRPASEAERAASWARTYGAGEADRREEEQDADDEENVEEDDEEELTASEAAPPPPGFGRSVTDGMLGCGCIALLIVGGVGLVIGWDYFDRTRYNRVSARVHSVAIGCVLEWEAPRDPAPWEKSGPRRGAEMACDEARRQTRGFNPRVVEVRTVTYSYTSPADGRTYPGALHADTSDFPPGVRAGGEMPVYALKADPSRSRGVYGWPVD